LSICLSKLLLFDIKKKLIIIKKNNPMIAVKKFIIKI